MLEARAEHVVYENDRVLKATEALKASDVALNYELPIHNFAFFAKAEVRNVFNNKAALSGNTLVLTNVNGGTNPANKLPYFATFNPFKDTPKECPKGTALADCQAMGANFQLGSSFGVVGGTATTFSQNGSIQLPRTYLYAIGARF